MERAIVIFITADAWRIGRAGPDGVTVSDVAIPRGDSPDEAACAVVAALDGTTGPGSRFGVMLALPAGPLPLHRFASMTCRPTTGVWRCSTGWRRSSRCRRRTSSPISCREAFGPRRLRRDRLRPAACRVLESHGVAIDAICPASLLALQRRLLEPPARGSRAGCGRLGERRPASSCSSFASGVLRSWSVLSDDPQDLRLHLGLEPLPMAGRRGCT